MKSCYYRKLCSLSRSQSRIMLHVNSRETTFEHQRVPAARFNNIFLKLFDRHATYCYLQVDLKSFLASGAFFLGREATERATISQVINSRHSQLFDCNSTETRNQHQQVARLGHLDNIFSRPRPSLAPLDLVHSLYSSSSQSYAVILLFPSLLTQYLFSACAIQPDLHVIRSCSQ